VWRGNSPYPYPLDSTAPGSSCGIRGLMFILFLTGMMILAELAREEWRLRLGGGMWRRSTQETRQGDCLV